MHCSCPAQSGRRGRVLRRGTASAHFSQEIVRYFIVLFKKYCEAIQVSSFLNERINELIFTIYTNSSLRSAAIIVVCL